MHPVLRIFGIGTVFVICSIGWLVLGGVTSDRTRSQDGKLGEQVNELWGRPQTQLAPELSFHYQVPRLVERTETANGKTRLVREEVLDAHDENVSVGSTDAQVKLSLDQRLKGLMWYSLYDVHFDGAWTYAHEHERAGLLVITFRFPDPSGIYDDFRFTVNGVERSATLQPKDGRVELQLPVTPGEKLAFGIGYKSRGMNQWSYRPAAGVSSLKDFRLVMDTDFAAIDFTPESMSPSKKERQAGGWRLDWSFARVVTGHEIGMRMPDRLQPGELASSLSFSAPISLFFFFLVIFVLSTLRQLDLHPINYFFIGGAFFAFHLLFAYTIDHLAVVPSFVVASVVSVLLVVSYLRLVVSNRFAFVEAAAAQLVYLVGFSLAYFWEGFTGLTVTVLSILTLFLLMQLTGRVRWGERLSRQEGAAGVAGA